MSPPLLAKHLAPAPGQGHRASEWGDQRWTLCLSTAERGGESCQTARKGSEQRWNLAGVLGRAGCGGLEKDGERSQEGVGAAPLGSPPPRPAPERDKLAIRNPQEPIGHPLVPPESRKGLLEANVPEVSRQTQPGSL